MRLSEETIEASIRVPAHEAAHAVVGVLCGIRPLSVSAFDPEDIAAGRAGGVQWPGAFTLPHEIPAVLAGYFGGRRALVLREAGRGNRRRAIDGALADFRDAHGALDALSEHARRRYFFSAALYAGRLVRRFWRTIARIADVLEDAESLAGRELAGFLSGVARAHARYTWRDTHAATQWTAAGRRAFQKGGRK